MTISERVYRSLLLAFAAAFRREYSEPMVQLFRDQMLNTGGGWWRETGHWMRIFADTARAAPALHIAALTGSGGGQMQSRTILALTASLLFAGASYRVVATLFWSLPGTLSFVQAHTPPEWPYPLMYNAAVMTFVEWIAVALAIVLFLLIMRKFSIRRLSRGALVAVPIVLAGVGGRQFLPSLRPSMPLIHAAVILPLLLSVALADWAANTDTRRRGSTPPGSEMLPTG